MDLAEVILLLMVLLNIGLAIVILVNNPKNAINRFFAFFILSIIFWSVSNYYANFYGDYALIWNKSAFLSAIFIAFSLVYFSLYFPKLSKPLLFWQHLLIILPTVLISFLVLFTNLIVAGVTIIETGTGVEQGSWYYIWPVYFLIYIISALWILIKKYRYSPEKEKNQIHFVFVGLVLSLLIGITTNLLFPFLLKNDTLSNVGPYATIVLVGFTAYAIVKYELLNIKVIATEALVIIINIALVFNVLYSEDLLTAVVRFVILLVSTFVGYLLIKSVQKEIKHRKQLQQLSDQLAHANEHLKELDKMKTEFVSLASHELLTPVSAIEGYLSMLLDEKLAKVDDPKAVDYLNHVYRSAKRLARLVADMLNVSRIEEGRLLVEKKEVNLSELIKQVAAELKFKADEHKQEIAFENPDGWQTYGDPDKIKEVIINLVGNSIKYSRNPGTITIKIEKVPITEVEKSWTNVENQIKNRPLDDQEAIKSAVDERLKRLVGENQLLIKVKDQGIGIPKEELPRLFKKFHRVGDFTTAESQGTGLGLYISRALVELQHGRIWADSEGQGKGSTFTFSLPEMNSKQAIESLEAQVPQQKEQLKPLAKPMKSAEEL